MTTSPQRASYSSMEKTFGRVVACATLAGLCLSYALWTCNRIFPTVPVAADLAGISQSCGALPFISLGALLITAIFAPARLVFATYALMGLVWGLLDQNRLQPWFFQSLLFFFALAAPKQRLELCRLILVGTYFWSGVQKINASFVSEVFPWMLSSVVDVSSVNPWISGVAMIVPLVELSFGLMLLSRRTMRLAAVGIIGMHFVILACIGPLGHNWNLVVWPWNLEMCALCFLLFLSPRGQFFEKVELIPATFHGFIVAVVVGLMPALNFVGLWDSYLSFALYSGNTVEGAMSFASTDAQQLPPEVLEIIGPSFNQSMSIDLTDWSLAELGVPSYPAERVFRSVAISFCRRLGEASAGRLEVRYPPPLHSGIRERRTFSCSELR